MIPPQRPWDYLVVTASNDLQAEAYRIQLELRRSVGQLTQVRELLVVADLEGRRIGSGGSTIECLRQLVKRERAAGATDDAEAILRRLRILILHAGGDSRRLPAYSPCGKLFVPVPGESYSALGRTLFDRLAPGFLALPMGGAGQVVVAAGDALIDFDPSGLNFAAPGITAVGAFTTPEEASRHGVFCPGPRGAVRRFLQKPSLALQTAAGALNRQGQAVLDVGLMSLDANAAAQLLMVFCEPDTLAWKPGMREAILEAGVDLYREICCAFGTESKWTDYVSEVRRSGGSLDEGLLTRLFSALQSVAIHLQVLERCSFLHFGATRQLITSGIALLAQEEGSAPEETALSMNNALAPEGTIKGLESWIEGCRIAAPMHLKRRHVLTGLDVAAPLALPEGACIDVSEGADRNGERVRFVRCYGVDDTFKHAAGGGATFCGKTLEAWMGLAGVQAADLWPESAPPAERTLWNARVFPAERYPDDPEPYRRWLWFFQPDQATTREKQQFLAADRYSAAEIATLADQAAFHARRSATRADEIERSLSSLFRALSPFSARDLAFALERSPRPGRMMSRLLVLAHEHLTPELSSYNADRADFGFARVAHSLGAALAALEANGKSALDALRGELEEKIPQDVRQWCISKGLVDPAGKSAPDLSHRLREAAFENLQESIFESAMSVSHRPRKSLRPDETIWGRCPARIELAGGWTDTPPYTLEYGGAVTNTAINLNGQPPIHCYCRIVEEPVIRLNSIDGGQRLEIKEVSELLDYRRPGDSFALAKAALAISGFAPGAADWPSNISLREILAEFGGGIELTTLVGIPQGSGLGTSSILGATILGVVARLTGKSPSRQELFHDVLRLEQALTTGGGWQDQAGGCTPGSKITSTRPGLFPDACVRYVPSDVIDPKLNGGCTLLYYTGLTRIAKNILKDIVGNYLNRDRRVMEALAEEYIAAQTMAETMAQKDVAGFGAALNHAWELQKKLCGTVTNPAIEELLGRVRPYVYGTRISGAGSGGFLLMVAKSPSDAARIRQILDERPHNDRSRFFDFEVNNTGLEVTTC